jgi:hypothetical protein
MVFALALFLFGTEDVRGQDYMRFATGAVSVPEVVTQLTFGERRNLVTHLIDVAKERYLLENPSNIGPDEIATFEKLSRYFPIIIIRGGGDEDVFGGLPVVTPGDLEEMAGGAILSYGKFFQRGDVQFQ